MELTAFYPDIRSRVAPWAPACVPTALRSPAAGQRAPVTDRPAGSVCSVLVRYVLYTSFIGLPSVPIGMVRFTVSSSESRAGPGTWDALRDCAVQGRADTLGSWDQRGRAGRHPRGPVKGTHHRRLQMAAWAAWSGGTWDCLTNGGGTGRSSELAVWTEPVCQAGSSRGSCRDQPRRVL